MSKLEINIYYFVKQELSENRINEEGNKSCGKKNSIKKGKKKSNIALINDEKVINLKTKKTITNIDNRNTLKQQSKAGTSGFSTGDKLKTTELKRKRSIEKKMDIPEKTMQKQLKIELYREGANKQDLSICSEINNNKITKERNDSLKPEIKSNKETILNNEKNNESRKPSCSGTNAIKQLNNCNKSKIISSELVKDKITLKVIAFSIKLFNNILCIHYLIQRNFTHCRVI